MSEILNNQEAYTLIKDQIHEAILHVTDGHGPSGEQDHEAVGRSVERILEDVRKPLADALADMDAAYTAFRDQQLEAVPHRSDCSLHNEPAYRSQPCDCGELTVSS